MDQWPEVESPVPIVPPSPVKTKRGRRKKARRKDPEELEVAKARGKLSRRGLITMSCSKCGSTSHNRRRCIATSAPQSKRPRNAQTDTTQSTTTNVSIPRAPPQTVRWMMDGSSQSGAPTQNATMNVDARSDHPSQASSSTPFVAPRQNAPSRPQTRSAAANVTRRPQTRSVASTSRSQPWR
ncbi:uncharacterized protein [Euphorbia lathyris]|uniref:uncharacterized protein n=1 Tax=Euphorbia lathyris TaxID=212925 RepID=UPI0033133660